jgi:quercetin dioxygenase-like cupin family protein
MCPIRDAEQRLTQHGRDEWFTGIVYLDEIAETEPPTHLRVHTVTFTPGARTALAYPPPRPGPVRDARAGRVQFDGEPVRALRPGDTVVVPPGRRHWHGAAPDHLFVHVAVQEAHPDTGAEATWHEHVTDDDYAAAPQPEQSIGARS